MYKAMDIAQYVINYAIDLNKPVSNLKLQKILYYIQAALLINTTDSFIEDEIYNWRHGPVIEEVYQEYKKYSNNPIQEKQYEYFIYEVDDSFSLYKRIYTFEERQQQILNRDKALIKDVVDSLIDYDPWVLVKETHLEDPWTNTKTNEIITKESIKEYFLENTERVYGEF